MMTFNHALADQILAQVLMEPESHNQATWGEEAGCGTTHCIAGWACALTPGVSLVWEGGNVSSVWEAGELKTVGETARRLLGLSPEQAHQLFFRSANARAIELLKDYANEAKAE
jgi:hypothetical protein